MRRAEKIAFIVLLMLFFTFQKGFAQGNIQKADTLRAEVQKQQSDGKDINQGKEVQGSSNRQTGTAGKGNASRSVKQIKGSRPDMTRARGARPPSIVRPSGSQVPRGVGRPGGAGHRGGR